MKEEYLKGIDKVKSDYSDIFKVIEGQNMWYVANYKAGNKNTDRLIEGVESLNGIHKDEAKKLKWQWHHIVDRSHMALFLSEKELEVEYNEKMPTVLLDSKYHYHFFSWFTRQVIFKDNAKISNLHKTYFFKTENMSLEEIEKTQGMLKKMNIAYRELYYSYPKFRMITNNYFEFHINRFNAFKQKVKSRSFFLNR